MAELTLENLGEIKEVKTTPDNFIELDTCFTQKINYLAGCIKDFFVEEHKLLFITGKKGDKFITCYFGNTAINVEWKEHITNKLTSDLVLTLDLRYLAKLLAYTKGSVILCDLTTEPSIWLYNNKVELIYKSLTREQIKSPDFEQLRNMDDSYILNNLELLNNVVKKYHLDKGCLSYDAKEKYYYKNFNLNVIGVLRLDTSIPTECISLETLKILSVFTTNTVEVNKDFTVISWKDGILKTSLLATQEASKPVFVKNEDKFVLDIDILKQLLKIIKLTHNTIQLELKIQSNTLFIEGYIEGQSCIEYSIDIETDTKELPEVKISIVLDSLFDVIKEFSGAIDVQVDNGTLQFTDGVYTVVLR